MGAKILTVDDSKMIRTLVGRALKPFDVRIVEAEDGAKGLEAARSERPDLILLDVAMPVMDGLEALRHLKKDPALKSIPVIMLTAEASRERVLDIIREGANYYILKPFDREALLAQVGKMIPLTARRNPARKYFAVDGGVIIVTVPRAVDRATLTELLPGIGSEVERIRGDGHRSVIIDLSGTDSINIPAVELVTALRDRCREAGISVVAAATPERAKALRGFAEAGDIPVRFSVGKARALLEGEKK
jgi:CheY-like chemotaxis protein/anti-anti-sigma regulatory factor